MLINETYTVYQTCKKQNALVSQVAPHGQQAFGHPLVFMLTMRLLSDIHN